MPTYLGYKACVDEIYISKVFVETPMNKGFGVLEDMKDKFQIMVRSPFEKIIYLWVSSIDHDLQLK